MKITRQSLISAAAVLAMAALSITPAMAATKVNVPFSFVASGKIFPAGTYTVDLADRTDIITLQGRDHGLMAVGLPSDPSPTGKHVVLKFDQVGTTYVLRTVQCGTQISSRLDKKARQLEAAQEMAIASNQ